MGADTGGWLVPDPINRDMLTATLASGFTRPQLREMSVESLIVLLNHTQGGVAIHTYDEHRGLPLVCCHPGHSDDRSYKGPLKEALIGAYLDEAQEVIQRERAPERHPHHWAIVGGGPGKTEWACIVEGCNAAKTTYGGEPK